MIIGSVGVQMSNFITQMSEFTAGQGIMGTILAYELFFVTLAVIFITWVYVAIEEYFKDD